MEVLGTLGNMAERGNDRTSARPPPLFAEEGDLADYSEMRVTESLQSV
jgi:hypothetical protein